MAKLILKAPYYKQGHKTEDGRGRGGYAEYIATREGVELLRGGMAFFRRCAAPVDCHSTAAEPE